MNRADLEGLDREALIARAEASGVTSARVLTRPELLDELLLRSPADGATKQRARGLFGRARDLLARVVEQGLHLPDAAGVIRSIGVAGERAPAPPAMPTVTLAEIYAAQGHRGRAVDTLEQVLEEEPDHPAARSLVSQLRDERFPLPPPQLAPEGEESTDEDSTDEEPRGEESTDEEPTDEEPAAAVPDDEPDAVAEDTCFASAVDPNGVRASWGLRERTLRWVRTERPDAELVLRFIVITPTWDGPTSLPRDVCVAAPSGEHLAAELPSRSVVRVAIGCLVGDSFEPLAHERVGVELGRQSMSSG